MKKCISLYSIRTLDAFYEYEQKLFLFKYFLDIILKIFESRIKLRKKECTDIEQNESLH